MIEEGTSLCHVVDSDKLVQIEVSWYKGEWMSNNDSIGEIEENISEVSESTAHWKHEHKVGGSQL